MKPKRLFLIAGYDGGAIIDASLMHLVRAAAELGDVIVYMDSDCTAAQIEKLRPYVLHADARRHGEYDFGSYKRAYMYARTARILPAYDFVYMLNDSVYGPLTPMGGAVEEMESMGLDAFGMVCNPHREHPHIQSWFIGCRPSVFMAPWFDEFMNSITRQPDKGRITKLYEQGFTNLVASHGLSWGCLFNAAGRGVYNNIRHLVRAGMPFMKKAAFPRMHGALGRQIQYVLDYTSPDVRDAILQNARRTWGNEYIHWLLTRNPVKIIFRNARHALHKVFVEGI